jgi:hypothetical protein
VSFSTLTVSAGGTAITATITVASTAQAGTGLPVTVQNGSLGGYGTTSYQGLTIT